MKLSGMTATEVLAYYDSTPSHSPAHDEVWSWMKQHDFKSIMELRWRVQAERDAEVIETLEHELREAKARIELVVKQRNELGLAVRKLDAWHDEQGDFHIHWLWTRKELADLYAILNDISNENGIPFGYGLDNLPFDYDPFEDEETGERPTDESL